MVDGDGPSGGGERGRGWHAAARGLHKHRSRDDLVAVARELIARGATSSDCLLGRAASAGAFTLGAALNLEPALFRAVLLEAPFLDVLACMLDPSLPLTVVRDAGPDTFSSPRTRESGR